MEGLDLDKVHPFHVRDAAAGVESSQCFVMVRTQGGGRVGKVAKVAGPNLHSTMEVTEGQPGVFQDLGGRRLRRRRARMDRSRHLSLEGNEVLHSREEGVGFQVEGTASLADRFVYHVSEGSLPSSLRVAIESFGRNVGHLGGENRLVLNEMGRCQSVS